MKIKKFKFRVCKTALITFSILFLFSSCKNFFSGNDLLANLQDAIDYNNIPYTKITLKTDLNYTNSLIPSEGIYDSSYRIGDTLTLSFEEKSNYNFLNWVIEPAEAMEYVNCRRGNHKVTLKVLTSADVTIYPLCVEKNTLALNFTADHAKVSPSDQVNYYIGDTFPISCYEEDDYCFIKWQVFDSEGNQLDDYSDYIDIDQPYNPLANVTVFKTGDLVTIKPLIVKRPKVVTATPLYSSEGVYCNRTLFITFDESMDISSIYYSEGEIENLTNAGYTLLTDPERGNRCYGYKDADGNITYKSIEIKYYGNEDSNCLQYYGVPYFNKEKNILKIDANKQNLPPENTDFIVIIKKGFCYKNVENDIFVHLKNDFSYIYKTGKPTDNKPPSFGRYDENEDDFVVRVVPENENGNEYNKNWTLLSETMDSVDKADLSNYNIQSSKIWIRGTIADGGTGVSSLDWTITKLDGISPYYPLSEPFFYSENICKFTQEGIEESKINQCIDLSNKNIPAGFYRIEIFLYDFSENKETFKSLYFLYDVTPPKLEYYKTDSYIPRRKDYVEHYLYLKFLFVEDMSLITFSNSSKSFSYHLNSIHKSVLDDNNCQVLDIAHVIDDGLDTNPPLDFEKGNNGEHNDCFNMALLLSEVIDMTYKSSSTFSITYSDIVGNSKTLTITGTFYGEDKKQDNTYVGFVIESTEEK